MLSLLILLVLTLTNYMEVKAGPDTREVPSAWTNVRFNSDVRYSQWIINSRINDFYANSTHVSFGKYSATGVEEEAPIIVVKNNKTVLDYVPGLVAKAIVENVKQNVDYSWAAPWYYSMKTFGDTYYNAVTSNGTSGKSQDDLNGIKMYFALKDLTASGAKYENSTTYGHCNSVMADARTGLNALNTNYIIGGSNSGISEAKARELGMYGGWWHKSSYNDQMWCDGLYMGPALLAQLINEYGEYSQINTIDGEDDWDLITRLFTISWNQLYDSNTGLLYHAFTANPEDNASAAWEGISNTDPKVYHSAAFWGRACGWYFLALVDILEQMDAAGKTNTTNYTTLKGYLNSLAAGLANYQDATTGCWYQVLDEKDSHLDGNYLESSCTAIFTAAYLKGIRLGYFTADYTTVAQKAYEGCVNQFMMFDANDKAQLIHCCASAGLGGNNNRSGSRSYYITGYNSIYEDVIQRNTFTEGKVLGGFILAATEYERTAAQTAKSILFSTDLKASYNLEAGDEIAIEACGADGANITYQWYKDGEPVEGATSATIAPTASGSYYCKATSGTTTIQSSTTNVTVPGVDTETPVFTTDLAATATATVGTAKTLTVAASHADGYQWYSNTTASNTSGTEIENATSASYTFTPSAAGTLYYYCVATNSNATGTQSVASAVCTVTVSEAPAETTYTVTFNATTNGGSCATASLTQASSGASITLPTATKSGYTFNGWYTASTGGTLRGAANASYTPTANETLYAQFTENSGTGGDADASWKNNVMNPASFFTFGSNTSVSTNAKTISDVNYTHSINMSSKSNQSSSNSNGYYIKFTLTEASNYNIVFGASGGSRAIRLCTGWSYDTKTDDTQLANGATPEGGIIATSSDVANNNFGTLSGSNLPAGTYYICGSGSVNIYDISITSTGGSTPTPTTYTVSYNMNGHGEAIADVTNVTALPDPLPSPTATGYTFGGWYTDSGLNTAATAGASISADTELYAKWTANTYSVHFDANGGEGSMTNESFTYGIEKALTANAFTRTGYTFAGWATSANGAKVYDDEESVSNLTATNDGTVDLYAKWTENQTPTTNYTVKFYNGDTQFGEAQEIEEGNTVSAPTTNPTKDGYTFKGWALSNGSTLRVLFPYLVYNDVNFYAVWSNTTSGGGGGNFSATATAKLEVPANTTSGQGISSDNATISGGVMYVYNGQDAKKDLITNEKGSTWAFLMSNSDTFFKVTLDNALVAGDKIKADIFGPKMKNNNNNYESQPRGLWMSTATSRPTSAPTATLSVTNTSTSSDAWLTSSDYTVTTGDGICGEKTFYIYRATANSTYFTGFTVTTSSTGNDITLDATTDYENFDDYVGENKNVTLKRSFTEGKWTTLVLPFSVTTAQLEDAFDNASECEIAKIKSMNVAQGNGSIRYTTVSSIEANKPVLAKIKPNENGEYVFTGVTVVAPESVVSTSTDGNVEMHGVYKTTGYTEISENAYFLSGGKFYDWSYLNAMSPFSAYILPVGVNTQSIKSISFAEDATGINETLRYENETLRYENSYNLAGQKVNENYNGIVIIKGKKVFTK